MKSFTKLALAALTIAIGFTACTKDNSASTTPTVKFSGKTSSALKLKDTIQPQVRSRVSPTVSRDTIQPK